MITDLLRIATKPAVTAPQSAPLSQVARVMAEHQTGSVVLVDDEHHLVGIVTDRDLVIRGTARGLDHDTKVSEVMTKEVASVLQHASTVDAVRQMANRNCRRLPVVDGHGAVLGVLSIDDVYRAEGEVLDQINRLLSAEHHDRVRGRL